MLELAYTYSADGLVTRIIETDEVTEAQGIVPPGQAIPPIVSQVDFEYDNRNRLIRETREETSAIAIDTGPVEYDLSYAYDAGGNRLSKTDGLTGRVTTYVYDIETDNAIDNNQHNNRLLGYDVTDTDPATGAPIAVEQTRYKYGPAGNVMLLVRQLDLTGDGVIDQADLAAVWWFYYDAGNHLWLAVQGTGIFDEPTGTLTNTMFDKAAEYRYDGGRQRYLVRQRDPNEGFAIVGTGQWRDYMGNNIYNDYTVDQGTGTVTNGIGYIPGIGFDDPALADSPAYLGSDLIGTTRRVVDSSTGGQGGTGVSPVILRTILTAFGEPLLPSPPEGEGQGEGGSGNTRYGYAGAWGYEEPEGSFDPLTDLGWLHVGERYYDPAIGRFMQRDPIGIRGGLNVYAYVANNPTLFIDPAGMEVGVLPNEDSENALDLGGGVYVTNDDGTISHLACAGAAAKRHGEGGSEHRKGKRKSTAGKHQKGKGHSSSKLSKAKSKLIKAGRWHFRMIITPLFIECRCGNGIQGIELPGSGCTCPI
jgi:RHS repeat-associated protein